MKIHHALIVATLVSTSALAQPSTAPAPAPAAAPADVSPTPAPVPPDANSTKTKKTAKKKTVKKKAAPAAAAPGAPSTPLMANSPAAAKQDNINVRGQAHINSETIGHLKKGEEVTVLEIITLSHPKADEPSRWAKIALPASLHVWVNTSYIDSGTQTVKANKLNLRSGPGENYSVIGQLKKGDAIKTVTTKGEWTQLEPPAGSFAFVAAHLLEPREATSIASNPTPAPTPTVVTPTPVAVDNQGTIAAAPTGAPGDNTAGVAPAPVPAPIAPAPPAPDEPAPKRIIERDGRVGGTVSIQSPSHYSLKNLDDGRTMDYLYTSSTNVDLSRYKGLIVHVTGEESLDERWPDTPVLTIQRIQVVK